MGTRSTSVTYDATETSESYPFTFAAPSDPALQTRRERYGLGYVVGGGGDLERVRRLCAWVHGRWQHDGLNEPLSPDPLTILEEAAQGKSFRCVEYGIVIAACAAALGLPSRVVQVETEDSETREYGASHVVSEVFLPDTQKWVFVDGQWNVIPIKDGGPLSGLELRLALDAGAPVTSFSTVPEATVQEFLGWIDEYLFLFVTRLDTRTFNLFAGDKLALIPVGAKEPTVFQRRFPVSGTTYTHSVRAFYAQP